MTIDNNENLIITIDGRTKLISKQQIIKAFAEPKASCANYERDNVDPIVESVRTKLLDRSQVGVKKYGTTLDKETLLTSEWIEHAIQEALDFSLYLTKLKEDIILWEQNKKI